MATLYPVKRIALKIHGKITTCPQWGAKPCGTYVIQRTEPGHGNFPNDPTRTWQLRVHVPNNTSQTPAQILQRAKFANAVASWQALTYEERLVWEHFGRQYNLPGYHEYLSRYLLGQLFV